jgi:hypothetical protein
MPESEPGPWDDHPLQQGPGAMRRDYEPHAAGLLRGLGWGALGCGILSYCCFGLAAPAGLAFGLAAWGLAWRESRRIRAGLVDPAAVEEIEQARRVGLGGAFMSALGAGIWLLLAWSMAH